MLTTFKSVFTACGTIFSPFRKLTFDAGSWMLTLKPPKGNMTRIEHITQKSISQESKKKPESIYFNGFRAYSLCRNI